MLRKLKNSGFKDAFQRGGSSSSSSNDRKDNGDELSNNTAAEGFICPVCMVSLSTSVELQTHFETVHSSNADVSGSSESGHSDVTSDNSLLSFDDVMVPSRTDTAETQNTPSFSQAAYQKQDRSMSGAFTCPQCFMIMASADELQLHFTKMHETTENRDGDIVTMRHEVNDLKASLKEEKWYSSELKIELQKAQQKLQQFSDFSGGTPEKEEAAYYLQQIQMLEAGKSLMATHLLEIQKETNDYKLEIESTKRENERIMKKTGHLAKEHATMKSQWDELTDQKIALGDEIVNVRDRNNSLIRQLGERPSEDDVDVLRKELVHSQTMMDQITQDTEKELQLWQRKFSDMELRNKSVEQEIDTLRIQLAAAPKLDVLSAKDELENKLSALQAHLNAKTDECVKITGDLTEAKTKFEEKENDFNKLKVEFDKTCSNNENLITLKASLEQQQRVDRESLVNVESSLEKVSSELEDANKKIEILTKNVNDKSCDFVKVSATKDHEIAQLRIDVEKLQQDYKTLQSENGDLQNQLSNTESRCHDQVIQLSETSASLLENQSNSDELARQLDKKGAKFAELEQEVEAVRNSMKVMENERTELMAKIDAGQGLDSAMAQLKDEITRINSEKAAIESLLKEEKLLREHDAEESYKQINEWKNKLKKAADSFITLETNLAVKVREREELDQKLSIVTAELRAKSEALINLDDEGQLQIKEHKNKFDFEVARVSELMSEVEKLKVQLEQNDENLTKHTQENTRLKESLETAQNSKNEIVNSKIELENEMVDKNAEITNLTVEVSTLKSDITAVTEKINSAEKLVLRLETELTEQEELTSKRDQIAQDAKMEYEKHLEQLNNELNNLHDNASSVQLTSEKQQAQSEIEIQKLDQKLSIVDAELVEKSDALIKLDDERLWQIKQVSELKSENEKLKVRLEQSNESLIKHSQESTRLKESLVTVENTKNEIVNSKIELENRVVDKDAEIINLTIEVSTLKSDITAVTEKVNSSEKMVLRLETQLAENDQIEQDARVSYEKHVEQLNNELNNLHAQFKCEIQALDQKLSVLTAELLEKSEALIKLDSDRLMQVNEYENKFDSEMQRVSELKSENEKLIVQLDQNNENLTKHNQEITQLKESLVTVENSKNEIVNSKIELENEMVDKNAEITNLTVEVSTLKSDITAVTEKINSAEKLVLRLETELTEQKELTSQSEQNTQDAKISYEKHLEQINNELNHLRHDSTNDQLSNEKQYAQFKSEIQTLDHSLTAVTAELREKSEALIKLDGERLIQVNEYKNKFDSEMARVSGFKSENEKLMVQLDQNNENLTKRKQEIIRLKESLVTVENSKNEIVNSKIELENEMVDKNAEITNLTVEVSTLKSDITAVTEKINSAEKLVLRLETELTEQKELTSQSEQNTQDAKISYEKHLEQINNELNHLRHDSTNDQLSNEKQYAQFKSEIQTLDHSLTAVTAELREKSEALIKLDGERLIQVNEYKNKFDSEMARVSGFKSENEKLMVQLDQNNENLTKRKQEIIRLKESLVTVENSKNEIVNSKIELENEMVDKNAEISNLTVEVSTLKSDITAVTENINSAEKLVLRLETELTEQKELTSKSEQNAQDAKISYEKHLEQINNELNHLRHNSTNDQLSNEKQYAQFKSEIQTLKNTLEAAQSSSQALAKDSKLQVDVLNENILKLNSDLSKLENQLAQSESGRISAVAHAEQLLSDTKEERQTRIDSLTKEITNHKNMVNEKTTELEKLRSEFAELQSNFELCNKSFEGTKTELINQKLELDNLGLYNEELKNNLASAEESTKLVEKESVGLSDQITDLNNQLEKSKISENQLKDLKMKLESELSERNKKFEDVSASLISAESKNADLEKTISTVKSDTEAEVYGLEKTRNALQQVKCDLEKQLNDQQLIIDEFEIERRKMREREGELQNGFESEKLNIVSTIETLKKEHVNELESKLEDEKRLYSQIDALTDSLGQLRVEAQQAKDLSENATKQSQKADQVSKELEAQKSTWQEEKRKIMERCIRTEEQLTEEQEMGETIKRKYNDILSAMHELGRENQSLQIDVTKHSGRKWVEDTDAVNCSHCGKEFSVTVRKHHCRNCGAIFCNECSAKSAQVAASKKPVRVCDSCYVEVTSK